MANQLQKPHYNADLFLPRRKFFHKASRCDISCAVARVQTEMSKVVEKLTGGEPLGIDQLIEYLPAVKEVARAQLDNWAKGAAVLHRYKKSEILCEEGDFGSTAFFIVSGSVDIFIHNPLSHVRTKPPIGIFGRSIARMKSFLADDKAALRSEGGTRQLIGIDANVDLPINKPLAQLGPGELFGEMTCRTYQPRSATVQACEACVMIEMLRGILDMLVGNRQVSDLTKATSRIKAPTFKGTSFKTELDKRYRERSLNNHLRSVPLFANFPRQAAFTPVPTMRPDGWIRVGFSAAQLKHKRCCSGRPTRRQSGSRGTLRIDEISDL